MPRLPYQDRIKKKLETLYEDVIDLLIEKVENKEIIASEIASIVKILKEEGIFTGSGDDDNDNTISVDLPFDIDD